MAKQWQWGYGRQTRNHWHHRDNIPWCQKRQQSDCISQRLLYKVQILSTALTDCAKDIGRIFYVKTFRSS